MSTKDNQPAGWHNGRRQFNYREAALWLCTSVGLRADDPAVDAGIEQHYPALPQAYRLLLK